MKGTLLSRKCQLLLKEGGTLNILDKNNIVKHIIRKEEVVQLYNSRMAVVVGTHARAYKFKTKDAALWKQVIMQEISS